MEFFFPTRIITGRGCVAENADRLSVLGDRCIIVTGGGSAKKCGALSDVANALESRSVAYTVYDKVTQNPLYTTCADGARKARECGAQFVIGIGGGSPLDAAKAVAFLAANPEAGEAEMYSQKLGSRAPNKALPVVAVGTTAGTGSEVTQIAVITDSRGRKRSFRSENSFPVLALGDPGYTEFMPKSVTLSTAADALCHCIESFFNKTATEFSKSFALRGAKLITEVFRSFDAENVTALQRDRLYLGSLFGGVAISITATCIPHALSYFLTENHGVPHGTACAVWIPEFIEHNRKFAPGLYNEFFGALGIDGKDFISLFEKTAPRACATVTEGELSELFARWKNNSCLSRAVGDIDENYLDGFVKKVVAQKGMLCDGEKNEV